MDIVEFIAPSCGPCYNEFAPHPGEALLQSVVAEYAAYLRRVEAGLAERFTEHLDQGTARNFAGVYARAFVASYCGHPAAMELLSDITCYFPYAISWLAHTAAVMAEAGQAGVDLHDAFMAAVEATS